MKTKMKESGDEISQLKTKLKNSGAELASVKADNTKLDINIK